MNRQFLCSLMMTGLMLILTITAAAQDNAPEPPLTVKSVETDRSGQFALFHTVKIYVENLDKWVKPDHDPSRFVINIDGVPFNGLPASYITDTDGKAKLQYDLKRKDENKDAWNTVLSRRRDNLFWRTVPVTVQQDGTPVQGSAPVTLTVINRFWFWIFVVSFLAALALFTYMAYKSDVIRDTGAQPTGLNKKGKPNRKPYSLARTQMAFWFFIVIISYVFIWMVTSDLTNLTPAVLGLIGISAATGLSAAIVDSNKQSEQQNIIRSLEEKRKSDEVEVEKLRAEITTLTAAINATPAPPDLEEQKSTLAAKQAELAAKQKEIEQAKPQIERLILEAQPRESKNFIHDILSDDGGVSFHRFQIFAWTIVLIFIFIVSVYNTLGMPDFPGTLLGLMGISGGTYIGFKMPNQQG
jgi:hypothetical protein